jgi:hypothetical protein
VLDVLLAIFQSVASLMSVRVKGGGRGLLSRFQGLSPRAYRAVLDKGKEKKKKKET